VAREAAAGLRRAHVELGRQHRPSQSSTEPRKLDTMVAIATISAKLATMPAMPIAAKRGVAASRVTASHHGAARAERGASMRARAA
jgi:hypothetical protein